MSRNIKEIGKELMGKSLNSFHRKTGLTQLEENNKMQDGILDGILSQVDNAYIEKTEQSNVIHLDGSGDGVVVVDSIEGNTMVNLFNKYNYKGVLPNLYYNMGTSQLEVKNGLTYTCITNTNVSYHLKYHSGNEMCLVFNQGYSIGKFTAKKDSKMMMIATESSGDYNVDVLLIEGDWTNREIPQYFGGLQSSFEDKANDEGKYEIEILMKNKNLIPIEYKRYESYIYHSTYKAIKLDKLNPNETYKLSVKTKNGNLKNGEYICISPTINPNHASSLGLSFFMFVDNGIPRSSMNFSPKNNGEYYLSFWHNGGITKETFNNMMNEIEYIQLEKVNSSNKWEQPKQNKIKLLINEPLRSTTLGEDRLCVVDGKLMIERKNKQIIINGEERYKQSNLGEVVDCAYFEILDIMDAKQRTQSGEVYCDRLPSLGEVNKYQDKENIFCDPNYNLIGIKISRSKLTTHDIDGIKTYFRNNNTKLCYPLKESIYEEVLNEYGEPILLEGYENGTIYIDSTIVPTTTVRYTPKMESFKVLKEVNNNNIMLTNDIDDNIIPYMMDVDLMIMEKEMALMSQYKIRRMGAKDMTSMQKRTQDMLERLIKGKTLTEQECKTRVAVYLNAGKITDEQAKELNFLIDEIYA